MIALLFTIKQEIENRSNLLIISFVVFGYGES